MTNKQLETLYKLAERFVVAVEKLADQRSKGQLELPISKPAPKVKPQPQAPATETPTCPTCNGPMVKRTRRADGLEFYGCAKFPECRGIRHIDAVQEADNYTPEDVPF